MSTPLEEHSKEELIEIIKSLKKQKKFGLVWEDEPEKVAEECKAKLPVLEEASEKEIHSAPNEPTNLIIEGDNYHTLSALNYTHARKIDVIYIDPPYNMGGDWRYNDHIINEENVFKHSLWLSFMSKRLSLAKGLLSSNGIIFISIDDHEFATLKLLCDEVFNSSNYISSCFILDNLKGKTNDNFITSVGHQILVYAKNKNNLSKKGFEKIENIFAQKTEDKFSFEDEYGLYNKITFKKTGQSKNREDRPNMFYPLLEKNGTLSMITEDEYVHIYNSISKTFDDSYLHKLESKYLSQGYKFILPLDSSGKYLRWTSGYPTCKQKIQEGEVFFENGVYQKTRPSASEMLQVYSSGTPKNFMYRPEFSTGTTNLNEIFKNDGIFPYPKPVSLIKQLLKLTNAKNSTVLDFFAGSGTTGQAVLELNKEDGGHRQFILCTNNENQIAEEVTYPRIKTVVTGIRPDGSKYSDGTPANVRYFKTAFVDKERSTDTTREKLVERSADMIRIRENAYEEIESGSINKYYDSKDAFVAVVFDPFSIASTWEEIEKLNTDKKLVKLYIFSYTRDTSAFTDEIPETQLKWESVPIPESILQVYHRLFEEKK
ncbi:MAG: site-specific DNA-methyltransferase [Candidatus Saccharibacteria bacterium]|nr:site-specific DNA-methyltransferase [Candidatus Saccharibacteria bacterium]